MGNRPFSNGLITFPPFQKRAQRNGPVSPADIRSFEPDGYHGEVCSNRSSRDAPFVIL